MNLDESPSPYDEHDANLYSEQTISWHNSLPLPHRKGQQMKTVLIEFFAQIFLVLNLFALVGNLTFSGRTWTKIQPFKKYCTDPPYSPMRAAMRYETRQLDPYAYNVYRGNNSLNETKFAWEELGTYLVWRATRKELEDSGAWHDDALRLTNGGYMATTTVYHEIHCLDWIKREWTDYGDSAPDEHLDHCLAALREGAMCHADLSIGSYYWYHQKKRMDAPRRCVEWGSLETYMKTRRLKFTNGIPENPLNLQGEEIPFENDDHLHTLETLGED